jgi:hypothetical protein
MVSRLYDLLLPVFKVQSCLLEPILALRPILQPSSCDQSLSLRRCPGSLALPCYPCMVGMMRCGAKSGAFPLFDPLNSSHNAWLSVYGGLRHRLESVGLGLGDLVSCVSTQLLVIWLSSRGEGLLSRGSCLRIVPFIGFWKRPVVVLVYYLLFLCSLLGGVFLRLDIFTHRSGAQKHVLRGDEVWLSG